MATEFEKAFENMTPEQRTQAKKAIGEMMGMPPHMPKSQEQSGSSVYNELELFIRNTYSDKLREQKRVELLVRNFVEKYPIDKIERLSLDEYLFSKEGVGNPDSYCRRIRIELQPLCSMGDARPDFFGIYRKDSTIELSRTFKKMFGNDYEAAFRYIKHEIYVLLESVANDDYQSVQKCRLNSLFKYKLLSIYFPDKIIPVCAKPTLEEYCDRVGLAYDKKEEMIQGIASLLEWKASVPEMANWSNFMLMAFCDWLWRRNRRIDGTALSKDRFSEKSKTIDKEIDQLHLRGEDREAVVKVRVNQRSFREILLRRYNKCCLCGVSNPDLLIASHIKPWRECLPEEKLDIDNGFLFCPNHDWLFDKGFISFSDDGTIMISSDLSSTDSVFTNVRAEMKIQLTKKNWKYLSYHRNKIFRYR